MAIARDFDNVPPTDTGPMGKLAGAGVASLYSGMILYAVGDKLISIDAWWLAISTILAFLVADSLGMVYDRFTEKLTTDLTVALEFGVFCALIFVGVLASAWATSLTADSFNTVGTLAYVAFFGLNIFPILGLYFDFLKRRKERLQRAL